MAMFDFANLFRKNPGGAGGWGATVKPEGAFFTRGPDGAIAGISDSGMQGMGKGLGVLGDSVGKTHVGSETKGAFAPPPPPPPPEAPQLQPLASHWSQLPTPGTSWLDQFRRG